MAQLTNKNSEHSVSASDCSASEPFALRVLGDSMAPEFKDGCIIIIDPAGVVNHGSYVLAQLEDEYIFRQLIIEDGHYLLRAVNSGYDSITITDLHAIQGVVVQQAGKKTKGKKTLWLMWIPLFLKHTMFFY